MADKQKFPSEVIDLPSGGKVYSKDSPMSSGKIEIKYMTAKEEDILTSQNLITKGVVIEKLIQSLIVTPGVNCDDLILGDKNAVMVAARILAYGPEYEAEVQDPSTKQIVSHTFNLTECPFKKLPKGVRGNKFDVKLPISKATVKFKILTGNDERLISKELDAIKKSGSAVSPELTTRLKYSIIEVDGETERPMINKFVDTMLSRDSLFLRKEMSKVSPDIIMESELQLGGKAVKVNIPMTVDFFWPSATG